MYKWYEAISDNSLEQGDIFFGYPLVNSNLSEQDILNIASKDLPYQLSHEADIIITDVILLTQSCDLTHDKTETAILCPLWKLDDIAEGKNKRNEIRKGRVPNYHLLNESDNSKISLPFSVVEFSRIFTSSKSGLKAFASQSGVRPRLNPPYREHLSQSFARYFMRVGLPTDIPGF